MRIPRGTPKFRFENSEDLASHRADGRSSEIGSAMDSSGLIGGVYVSGVADDEGRVSNGITFTAGQTRDIPHGMGRPARGFVVVDATGSQPLLYRTILSPADGDDRFVRLTHAGASSTTVKLLVL